MAEPAAKLVAANDRGHVRDVNGTNTSSGRGVAVGKDEHVAGLAGRARSASSQVACERSREQMRRTGPRVQQAKEGTRWF